MSKDSQTAFFSYSRQDSEFALRLARQLKEAGANVWMDQLDITPGQRWERAVEEALNNSPRVLVIYSPAAVSSTNVSDEVNFALEEHKTVIPVLYQDCKFPFRVRPFQYVDFRTDYARGIEVILQTLGVQSTRVDQATLSTTAVQHESSATIPIADDGNMLNTFMNIARTESRSEILKWFLRMFVLGANRGAPTFPCDFGFILIYRQDGKLHLFNDDQFLFQEGLLERQELLKTVFEPYDDLPGRAFSTRTIQYVSDLKGYPSFVNHQAEPMKSMLCAPIILPSLPGRPFGVACFLNRREAPPFSREARLAMDLAVNSLSFALELAGPMPSDSVFIAHGRNVLALRRLELLLLERAIKPIIVTDQAGNGGETLKPLEDLLAECQAGFVLLTPDDEGRRINDPMPYKARASQNVIFEAGQLTGLLRRHNRICFLQTDPSIELPSDLAGLRWQLFDPERPDVGAIEKLLTMWGTHWERPGAR